MRKTRVEWSEEQTLIIQLEVSGGELLSPDSAGELDVSDHDGDSSGVDGAEVGVFEQADQVGFDGFLESEEGRALESELAVRLVGDVLDDSLERKLSDQKISGLLVSSDLSESDSSGPVSMGLLESSSLGGTLSGSFRVKSLSGSLDTGGGLSSSSLSSGHCEFIKLQMPLELI